MCTVRCFFILIISIGIFSCNSNKGDKLRDFYLSQPRDKNLFGWWDADFKRPEKIGKNYIYFTDGKQVYYEVKPDGKLDDGSILYWYTKDNILFTCYPINSWVYGNYESKNEYKISNDTLYEKAIDPGGPVVKYIRADSPL